MRFLNCLPQTELSLPKGRKNAAFFCETVFYNRLRRGINSGKTAQTGNYNISRKKLNSEKVRLNNGIFSDAGGFCGMSL